MSKRENGNNLFYHWVRLNKNTIEKQPRAWWKVARTILPFAIIGAFLLPSNDDKTQGNPAVSKPKAPDVKVEKIDQEALINSIPELPIIFPEEHTSFQTNTVQSVETEIQKDLDNLGMTNAVARDVRLICSKDGTCYWNRLDTASKTNVCQVAQGIVNFQNADFASIHNQSTNLVQDIFGTNNVPVKMPGVSFVHQLNTAICQETPNAKNIYHLANDIGACLSFVPMCEKNEGVVTNLYLCTADDITTHAGFNCDKNSSPLIGRTLRHNGQNVTLVRKKEKGATNQVTLAEIRADLNKCVSTKYATREENLKHTTAQDYEKAGWYLTDDSLEACETHFLNRVGRELNRVKKYLANGSTQDELHNDICTPERTALLMNHCYALGPGRVVIEEDGKVTRSGLEKFVMLRQHYVNENVAGATMEVDISSASSERNREARDIMQNGCTDYWHFPLAKPATNAVQQVVSNSATNAVTLRHNANTQGR